MARTGFMVQKHLVATNMLDKYSDEELGRLFRTMIQIANGIEPSIQLTREEQGIINSWKDYDDIADKRYWTSVENGKKGGRPKNNPNEPRQTETNQDKPTETQTILDKPIEKKRIEKNRKEKTKIERFVKPTVEEVREYCIERNNGINADTFVSFYESKGWLVGKSPMKDWKACVRTWEQNDYGKPKAIRKPMISDISERNNDWDNIAKSLPNPLEEII